MAPPTTASRWRKKRRQVRRIGDANGRAAASTWAGSWVIWGLDNVMALPQDG